MSLQIPTTEIEYRNALIDAAELGAKMSNRATYLNTEERQNK